MFMLAEKEYASNFIWCIKDTPCCLHTQVKARWIKSYFLPVWCQRFEGKKKKNKKSILNQDKSFKVWGLWNHSISYFRYLALNVW